MGEDNCNSNISIDPKVSVIIPCYNAEFTIEKTLNSLEKQTYREFEVIIVNDGSKDKTEEIIKTYLSSSELKIKYIIQENAGVSVARNVGLANAKGEYIMFLDADDIYHQDYINILYSALYMNDVDTAYCCYSRDVEMIFGATASNKSEYHINTVDSMMLLNNFMHRKGPCAFFTYIYKKSILECYGISFTETSKYGEDLEFTWKYLSHCKIGMFINISLYGYRDNPYSAINNISWRVTDALSSVKRVEEYLKSVNNSFFSTFKSYMFARTLLAVLKDFAKSGRRDLFNKLVNEHNPKKYMVKIITSSPDYLVRITALVLFIDQSLFFNFINKYYSKK